VIFGVSAGHRTSELSDKMLEEALYSPSCREGGFPETGLPISGILVNPVAASKVSRKTACESP
jgi:hypothetical protein